MMKQCSSVVLATVCLLVVVGATASPVRRSPDLEARRRSAIDRSFLRFGRSYPPEPSAAEMRDSTFQRPTRRGNSFLRLGRSQPLALTTDDLIALLRSYDEDYELGKRASNFVRLGRDPKFIRLGRSADEEKSLGYEQSSDLIVNGYPQRKHRARDHFVRLGRDSEELGDMEDQVERRKREAEECHDCH